MKKDAKKKKGGAKKSRTTVKSLTEKMREYAEASAFMEEVSELSDEEVKKSFNAALPKPSGKFTSDAAVAQPEYNGPIPLGFRAVPPSHMMSFKGPIGKALRHFGARNFFIGDQMNAWFDQNIFINKADSMPGEDAVAAGYEFSVHGKKDKALVDTLDKMFHEEHFNLDETLREFDHNKRCFGAALMIPCFEEDVDMSLPLLDYAQLKGLTFIGWTNIEPYYLSPQFDSNSRSLRDPTYKHYMVPDRWNVFSATDGTTPIRSIHRSWIFFRRNIITSKIYQPMYKWQGPSIPQMIVERLYSAEACANESSMLLRSKRTFVMEADVRKMTANPEWTRKFLTNCSANAANWGIRVVPYNSNVKQMDSLLSECMPLTTAQYGILCAEISIPSPKFMMAQLTGFANSGNYEVKLYVQKERELQLSEFVPIVKQTCRIAYACDTGKTLDFDVRFNDVDVPTVVERSEIMYEEARAAKFLSEADAIKKGAKKPNSHHTKAEEN